MLACLQQRREVLQMHLLDFCGGMCPELKVQSDSTISRSVDNCGLTGVAMNDEDAQDCGDCKRS